MKETKPKGMLSRLVGFLLSKLPWAATKPAAPGPAVAVEGPPSPKAGQHILIVDDDKVIVKVLSNKLKAKGYDIKTAQNPADALAVVREQLPDLILLDLGFPLDASFSVAASWDGFALMQWLQGSGLGVDVPIFIISSESPEQCQERFPPHTKPAAFFQKPIDHEALIAAVKRILSSDPSQPNPTP